MDNYVCRSSYNLNPSLIFYMIKTSKEIVRHNEVERISDSLFKVRNEHIKIATKKGSRILTCSCQNHTFNCNNLALCYHKLSVLYYLGYKDLLNKINKTISDYKRYNNLKLPVSIDLMIDDLESLRGLI